MKRMKPTYSSLEGVPWTSASSALIGGVDDAPDRDMVDHDRARQLILEQTERLLPANEANLLSDHLLVCDRCYRFAQEVAARERKRTSGEFKAI